MLSPCGHKVEHTCTLMLSMLLCPYRPCSHARTCLPAKWCIPRQATVQYTAVQYSTVQYTTYQQYSPFISFAVFSYSL